MPRASGQALISNPALLLRLSQKDGSVCVYDASRPESRSRPTAKSSNVAIAVEENTSESKLVKIVKFLLLDFV